jgi:phenylacetate-CoA ligase
MTMAAAYPFVVRADRAWRTRPRRRARRLGVGLVMRSHETLLHRPSFSIAEALGRSETLPAARLRELQLTKLRRLLAHAAAKCPYYRDHGLPSPNLMHDLPDLAAIELLTRHELRRHGRSMRWSAAPDRVLIGHTHGTADEPLAFFWNRRRQAWDKANRLRAHHWHGFAPGDRELHLWPLDPPTSRLSRARQWLRERRDDLFCELQIDSLQTFNERLPLAWRAWRQFDPVRVTAYPSALARLIADGRRVGCRIGNPSLRSVFLTGEVTFDWQRQLIERELGVPTTQDYGVQEVGALAYECPHGAWHTSAESAFIEILRDGRPALSGEYGEVVVTGLESLAMPILRYCTGDIVRLPENWGQPADASQLSCCPSEASRPPGPPTPTCRCGRTLPILPPVRGRATDFLESATGTWIEPTKVVDSLGLILEEGTFQAMQAGDGSVEVRVIGEPAHSAKRPKPAHWAQAVKERLAGLLGPGIRCTVKQVPSLTRSLFGKCRYVSSERTMSGLARR